MLNKKQKEELIVKLLEEDKTYKEISKEAHASFSEISRINKILNGEIVGQVYKIKPIRGISMEKGQLMSRCHCMEGLIALDIIIL